MSCLWHAHKWIPKALYTRILHWCITVPALVLILNVPECCSHNNMACTPICNGDQDENKRLITWFVPWNLLNRLNFSLSIALIHWFFCIRSDTPSFLFMCGVARSKSPSQMEVAIPWYLDTNLTFFTRNFNQSLSDYWRLFCTSLVPSPPFASMRKGLVKRSHFLVQDVHIWTTNQVAAKKSHDMNGM